MVQNHIFLLPSRYTGVMNNYEIVRQIGEGAFGKAFLARDRDGGCETECVVKEVNLRKVDSQDALNLISTTLQTNSAFHCLNRCLLERRKRPRKR